MDFLKSAVASAISKGPLAAYALGEQVNVDQSIWTLHNATKREGNVKCSVFSFDAVQAKSRVPIAKNAVRKSRTLHHPGVVKVLDTIETESNIYIVTERISPVSNHTGRGQLSEETLKWGLHSIAKTVKFVNNEASSVHGCLRASSIFSSESGEWKLGGFELLSSMNDEDAVIYTYSSLVPDLGRYLPPEVVKSGWDTIKKHPLTAVDSWGFGILVYEVFNGTWSGGDGNVQPGKIPPTMQQSFKRLINSNPKLRLGVGAFLDQGRRGGGGFFNTPLINVSESIESLGLKSDGEREQFLGELKEVSDDFPENYLQRKVMPELLKSVEFGGGGAPVFNVVLKIGDKLSEEDYEANLIPVIIRLFNSPDRAIRVCLLDNLPLMIDHLSQKVVNDKIFTSLTTGFTDIAPIIREQTVKSVLTIITKLSDRTINGELLRYLAKTANDAEPGIRTNTTICLGKIARQLSGSTRSKVLVAAFTRSLRDPFLHARNAALLAIGATMDLFSEDDCAGKLLPAVCPSLVDKDKLVRDQANKTLETLLNRVRAHAETLPETSGDSASVTGPRTSTPSADSSSWAGWAISSFTNKLSNASGQIEPKQPVNGAATLATNNPALRPVTSNPTSRPSSAASGQVNRPDMSRNNTSSTKIAQSFTQPVQAETNGFWDDFDVEQNDADGDGWGGMDEDMDDDTKEAPSQTSSRPSSTVPPASRSKPTSAPTATFDDRGEPDFAAWLSAKQGTAKKTPLPKGLGTKKGTAAAPTSTATRKVVHAPKKAEPKKQEPENDEDGWGDAWD